MDRGSYTFRRSFVLVWNHAGPDHPRFGYQVFLDHGNGRGTKFWMRIEPSVCKMLLQNRIDSKLNFGFVEKELTEVHRSNYFGDCIPSSDCIMDDVSSCLQKARSALTNLRHPWHRRNIWLPINEVYTAAPRSVLLNGLET